MLSVWAPLVLALALLAQTGCLGDTNVATHLGSFATQPTHILSTLLMSTLMINLHAWLMLVGTWLTHKLLYYHHSPVTHFFHIVFGSLWFDNLPHSITDKPWTSTNSPTLMVCVPPFISFTVWVVNMSTAWKCIWRWVAFPIYGDCRLFFCLYLMLMASAQLS